MGLVNFINTTSIKYNALSKKDKDTIYHLDDTKELIIKGNKYNSNDYLNPTNNFIIYLSPNGNDDNDGLEQSRSMKSLRGAVAKYGYCTNLEIKLADGVYTDILNNSPVNLFNSGKIRVTSISGIAQNVLINHSIDFKGGYFSLNKVTVNKSANYALAVTISEACGIISRCIINGNNITDSYGAFGIVVNSNSNIALDNVTINTCYCAITAYMNSTIYCLELINSTEENLSKTYFKSQTGSIIYTSGIMKSINKPSTIIESNSQIINPEERNLVKYLNKYNIFYVYVSPTGDDNNAGTIETLPMKTIEEVIRKYGYVANLYIYLFGGEYTNSGAMTFPNNKITINCYNSNKDNVIINSGLAFSNCYLELYNVTIKKSRGSALTVTNSKATIKNCTITILSDGVGIDFINSSGNIEGTEINKSNTAVRAENSQIFISNCTSKIINSRAFLSTNGSTIVKNGTVPLGGGPDIAGVGGIIR